ncbi:hypothetical protein [Microbacterium hatanonis]|uniref:Sensor domain-containing protein n=1 Tax=Microbacterium hatanonis TaxID=404366 RepID=A0A5C8HYI2_9MICO|nr:hypothetical protein [Microbacterium hatanonis]TXK10332.1 hypothetical protein FVP77_15930 [Microbacterium hatanonis]
MTARRRSGLAGLAFAGVLALALAGCAGGETSATPDAAASATLDPSAASEADRLSAEELTALFDKLQFPPGEYDTSAELLSSIYPGLTVSDPSCLAPFGAGWESAVADDDTAAEMATSNDRSMTAVVVSSADPDQAATLFADAEEALATCADGSQSFELSGVPVDLQLETTPTTVTGTDEAVSWRATGEVAGSPFRLVGITAVHEGTAIALVGWDPATSADYVPAATQMFIDGF